MIFIQLIDSGTMVSDKASYGRTAEQAQANTSLRRSAVKGSVAADSKVVTKT